MCACHVTHLVTKRVATAGGGGWWPCLPCIAGCMQRVELRLPTPVWRELNPGRLSGAERHAPLPLHAHTARRRPPSWRKSLRTGVAVGSAVRRLTAKVDLSVATGRHSLAHPNLPIGFTSRPGLMGGNTQIYAWQRSSVRLSTVMVSARSSRMNAGSGRLTDQYQPSFKTIQFQVCTSFMSKRLPNRIHGAKNGFSKFNRTILQSIIYIFVLKIYIFLF